jgi:hypothetical protein
MTNPADETEEKIKETIYRKIFGCKAQTKIKRQIPQMVIAVIVTSIAAKRSMWFVFVLPRRKR